MYLRYTENQQEDTQVYTERINVKPVEQKNEELSKPVLILCLSCILFILNYTKEQGYFVSTEEQFILAACLGLGFKTVIESFRKWISK